MFFSRGLAVMLPLCVWSGAPADQLCLTGDFDAQAQQLMDSQTLTLRHPTVTRLLDDIRATLNKRWKGFEMLLHGSLAIGLGIKGESDVDLFVRMPINSSEVHLAVVYETIHLLQQQPDLYSPDVTIIGLANGRPFFTFYHIPTQTYCDIGFGAKWFDSIGNLLHYFYNLDKLFLPLGRLIKLWCTAHQLNGHFEEGNMSNFLWYSLTLLYLQQKHLAPPVYELQSHSNTSTSDDWDKTYEPTPYPVRNNESLYQLLGGFFQYYSQFDFQNYIVSPFAGRPIHRSQFLNFHRVPDEFTLYRQKIFASNNSNLIPLELWSPLCIQHPFIHTNNVAYGVSQEVVSRTVSHIKWAAKMYEELPSDKFLTTILTRQNQVMDSIKGDTVHKLQDASSNNCIDVS